MNRYELMFRTPDNRIWQVTIKADGVTNGKGAVVFWRRQFLWWRKTVHVVSKDMFISAVGDRYNG